MSQSQWLLPFCASPCLCDVYVGLWPDRRKSSENVRENYIPTNVYLVLVANKISLSPRTFFTSHTTTFISQATASKHRSPHSVRDIGLGSGGRRQAPRPIVVPRIVYILPGTRYLGICWYNNSSTSRQLRDTRSAEMKNNRAVGIHDDVGFVNKSTRWFKHKTSSFVRHEWMPHAII